MTKIKTLRDGLLDELKDLYSAEHQLLKALPKVEKKASSEKLKSLVSKHLKETEGQIERLDKISMILQESLSGKTCKAMQGLIEECKEILTKESENDAIVDALLIGAATRVEHYEMASYTISQSMAEELGEGEVAKLLEATLAEETKANEKLCALSKKEILVDANLGQVRKLSEVSAEAVSGP